MQKSASRRKFLTQGIGGLGGLFFLSGAVKAFAEQCGLTPAQTAGPFYPGNSQFTTDTDLTRVPGRISEAVGQRVLIHGRILDQNCQPVKDANVEIWQACASGKYNNPRDPNPAPLDPNFRYWGETYTDENGAYAFKTVKPGAYPADVSWDRPPHIHFRIAKLGYRELVTQMYFKGDPLNDSDAIILNLPEVSRSSVIVDFVEQPDGSLRGNFDITIVHI